MKKVGNHSFKKRNSKAEGPCLKEGGPKRGALEKPTPRHSIRREWWRPQRWEKEQRGGDGRRSGKKTESQK